MDSSEESLIDRLRKTFRVEAEEHLTTISSGLIAFEAAPSDSKKRELLETMFRAAHSLKGAARSVNYVESERLCHALESTFAALKRDELSLTASLFDAIHSMTDCIRASVLEPEKRDSERDAVANALIRKLEDLQSTDLPQNATSNETRAKKRPSPNSQEQQPGSTGSTLSQNTVPATGTVRVSATNMGALMTQVEEMLGPKLAAIEHSKSLSAFLDDFQHWRKAMRPNLSPADDDSVAALEFRLKELAGEAETEQRKLAGSVDTLLVDMKRVLMMPFNLLHEMLPKLVRDLSRSQGKDVALVVEGGGIEVDRRIQDELRDVILHIIRNCIDHGIESPEERTQKGKSPRGTVTVTISEKSGNRVEIQIRDDGRGIDRRALLKAAVKAGHVSMSDAETMSETEMLALAFQSGLSTSPLITDVSGRGLGLAIVRDRIDHLGGNLKIHSELGTGTTIHLTLPITMAAFRGILVRVGDTRLIVPTLAVERVVRVKPDTIQTVENRETLRVNGAALSLARLHEILELPSKPPEIAQALVIGVGVNRMAVLVDEALSEQEVIVKGFGLQLARVRNISGAAVLGTGVVVPILNVRDVLNAAARVTRDPVPAERPIADRRDRRTVLLAEDSITARTLLKGILETAGFQVYTAVDGAEALAIARMENIDMVVSDIEMPRMNGFDLTARIRSDKKLSKLPVVLVTALESREDRERGMDVGANAYIAKSSFDQSNLLEVIHRLL